MKSFALICFSLFMMQFAFAQMVLTPNSNQITTIEEGVLTVAVTNVCTENAPHHNCWVYKIVSSLAEKYNLELKFKKVEFNNSWRLADNNTADIVATGISQLPGRDLGKATYSNIYSIVKRGIKIKRENSNIFKVLADFKGYRVAAVKGMTSELDLSKRAIEGIEIVRPDSWDELYDLFNTNKVEGIAEGFYVFPGDEDEINEDGATVIVDVHDLEEGKIEGNQFVVRNSSVNLLEQLNQHIKDLGLPDHRLR